LNLTYSLINQPWFASDRMVAENLPLLYSIYNGIKIPVEKVNQEQYAYYSLRLDGQKMDGDFNKTESSGKIYVLPIKGSITKYDQECGPMGTQSLMKQLSVWEKDETIAGVVLDIDSGGGQAYGTAEFQDFLLNYSKPTVAYTSGLMCSAAYYIASGCDHIIANKNADYIGSIGVMMSFLDLIPKLEKEGAKFYELYASKSTEKNHRFRKLLKGNSEKMVEDLDYFNEKFIGAISSTRQGINKDVFAGGDYPPTIALEKGLIDEIGTMQNAFNYIQNLNQKTNNMKKTYPTLSQSLGMTEELEATKKFMSNATGTFLQEEQLDLLESKMAELDKIKADLTESKTLIETKEKALADLTQNLTEQKQTIDVLQQKIKSQEEELSQPKKIKLSLGDKDEEDGIVDPNASHNQIAEKIINQNKN
jgi:protease-4